MDATEPAVTAQDESVSDRVGEGTDGMGNGASSLVGLFTPRSKSSSSKVSSSTTGAPHDVTSKQHEATGGSETSTSSDDNPQERVSKPSASPRRSTIKTNNHHTKTLMEFFENPSEQPVPSKERTQTHLPPHERLPLLHNRKDSVEETPFGDLFPASHEKKGSFGGFSLDHLFSSPLEPTPKTSGNNRKVFSSAVAGAATHHVRTHTRTASNMPAIDESKGSTFPQESPLILRVRDFSKRHLQATTLVGSCMFLLYHVVFCLAMGSSIMRKNSETPILGLMAKVAACGVIFASPVYIWRLGNDIPALYPTVDLFLAPFISNLASIVDSALEADDSLTGKDEDQVFIATLMVLSGIGMIFSGTLLVAASKFKLANLGSYLPFPVLCGFFSAVGILMWSLAFTVDNNGKSVKEVFTSGDLHVIGNALLHHFPSLLIAITMKWLGRFNPFYVSGLVVCTVLVFYSIMAITGTSLEEAREQEWFWSHSDLVYAGRVSHFGFDKWAPPAPFGVLNSLVEGKVYWGAVSSGMSTVCALSFLYLLRCSIHGTSLKKNVPNLSRVAKEDDPIASPQMVRRPSNATQARHRRLFSEALDIEAVANSNHENPTKPIYRAKDCHVSLGDILLEYGHSQYVSAVVGSFGVTPSVAASPTMFSLGTEGVAPQYGSVLLLLVFYLTDFQMVSFIPKAAFSSLIVLAFLDIMITWCFKSYKKTLDKLEWLVVPVIIVSAFVVGLLNAVFIGIAASTLLFVAAFFRSGVVKFMASGVTVRSTIERPFASGDWLDRNGDLIQILVMQNYLFFGNASSILAYIAHMFEETEAGSTDGEEVEFERLQTVPKFVILDFTLVTGMDTSTVDVIAGILQLCKGHKCKLFLAGLSLRMRMTLALGGIKPETGERSQRKLRFFPDLDSALGKAEDLLLSETRMYKPDILDENRRRLASDGGDKSGLGFALRHIDEQHGKSFAQGLQGIQEHTRALDLAPGECLFSCDGGPIQEDQRGLFFIEEGIMKIERDSSITLTRGSVAPSTDIGRTRQSFDSDTSLGRTKSRLQNKASGSQMAHHFRVARIGPGWVLGSLEGASGHQNTGYHVAVSHCRLHHLPFSKLEEIEQKEPKLALAVYKLLAHLMGRRQEVTVEQLATLHSIMTSLPLKNPTKRPSSQQSE